MTQDDKLELEQMKVACTQLRKSAEALLVRAKQFQQQMEQDKGAA